MGRYHLFKINITKLNIANIVLLIICFIFTALLFPTQFQGMLLLLNNNKFCILFLPLMIIYFSLHELLHAIGYILNGANYQKITFGMELEKSVFYCLCKDEITKRNILLSLMYPLFFIGIITYVISIIFNYPILLLLSIINIGGAVGDIMYFLFIVKLKNNIMYSEMDDGTAFAIISNDDPSQYKHFGLDYIGVENKISRQDFKRIKISKLSAITLIISLLLIIFSFFI